LSRRALAEIVNIDNHHLANIENEGTSPSLPVIIQIIKACVLPVERYFTPGNHVGGNAVILISRFSYRK